MKSIRRSVRNAIDELDESGQSLQKYKKQKDNIAAWTCACETFKTALEELDEVYATVLTAAPQEVQDEIEDGEELDTSPDAIQKVQMEMKAHLRWVEPSPAGVILACEAACRAAEVMFRNQLAMADQTHDAVVKVADQARDMAFQSAMLVYRDTCMQALKVCS